MLTTDFGKRKRIYIFNIYICHISTLQKNIPCHGHLSHSVKMKKLIGHGYFLVLLKAVADSLSPQRSVWVQRFCFGLSPTDITVPKNLSSWQLNKQEQEELRSRVEKGEDEATIKRELQTLKAQRYEDRKASASAVAQRYQLQG